MSQIIFGIIAPSNRHFWPVKPDKTSTLAQHKWEKEARKNDKTQLRKKGQPVNQHLLTQHGWLKKRVTQRPKRSNIHIHTTHGTANDHRSIRIQENEYQRWGRCGGHPRIHVMTTLGVTVPPLRLWGYSTRVNGITSTLKIRPPSNKQQKPTPLLWRQR